MQTVDFNGKSFHFIGIGGIGMSGLAYILAKRRFLVSGSDIRLNHITEKLQSVGAKIFSEQQASNLEQVPKSPQIIWSTAISNHNSEYQAAIERGLPIFHRSDLLAALIKEYDSIAVSGTHGKTTTSSLIGYLLLKAGLDPSIIVGGEVKEWGGNARLGQGNLLVAEADESDGSLIKHIPKIGIITNIELDHLDHYQNIEQLIATFKIFARQCETLIGCIDCQIVKEEIKPEISYSLDPDSEADYIATEITYRGKYSQAQVWEKGKYLGIVNLQIPGKHNISNALGAIAVGRKLELNFETIAEAIANFTGAKRRFEVKGKYKGATLVDDYAHHPSEISATLKAARLQVETNSAKRIIAIFQPHRYSRTEALLREFATAFAEADLVIITDIYGAGENNPKQITGAILADAVKENHDQVIYHDDLSTLAELLQTKLQQKDLALFLGAGNLNQVIPQLIAQ